jgi:hypothetical protein
LNCTCATKIFEITYICFGKIELNGNQKALLPGKFVQRKLIAIVEMKALCESLEYLNRKVKWKTDILKLSYSFYFKTVKLEIQKKSLLVLNDG